jgi:hypothetical protein
MRSPKGIERKTASFLLYALEIAPSNLKRMELEKPQPEQLVVDLVTEEETPIAALKEEETVRESSASTLQGKSSQPDASIQTDEDCHSSITKRPQR